MKAISTVFGRDEPVKYLNELLKSNKSSFTVIYGRRRVGKTFLIREHLKEQIAFDFTGAYETETSIQLNNFFDVYLKVTKGQIESKPPKNWHEAFGFLAKYLDTLNKNKKHVVFIDELPWLDNHKSGLVSALAYFWNQHASQMKHIMLLVCGSATSWMRKKIILAKGGLYNRVTDQIKLEPFNLRETEAFLKHKGINFTRFQIIELYMCTGGIPFYLEQIQRGMSAPQVIDSLFFDKTSVLYHEFERLYPSIFNQAQNHVAIIEALAAKPRGMLRKDLVAASGLTDGGIFTRTIMELEESGFINFYQPLFKKKKNTIYKLADFYSLFYCKFVKNNKHNGAGTWQKLGQSASYLAWSGYAYENVCYHHIKNVKQALGISGIFSNTASWSFVGNDELPATQIDLLIDREDRIINICEVKFSANPYVVTKDYAGKLRTKQMVLEQVTKTKKNIQNILISTYPALQNAYYLEQIDREINMESLF